MKPVCRNIQNNQFYFYEGNNVFRNIRTGNAGEVDEDRANKIFAFNPALSQTVNEYPIIENFISKLNLCADVVSVRNEK